jgi:hypothetical protein
MKIKMQSLAVAAVLYASMALGQAAQAADNADHAALAAQYDKLAATQQAILDDNLKLRAESRAGISPKSGAAIRAVLAEQGYDAMAAAASAELADLQRYAKWHRLEAAGAASNIGPLVADQQGIIDASIKLKAARHASDAHGKVAPSSRYQADDRAYEAKIAAASSDLADLQGFAKWHKLAEAGAADEVAKLSADQQAVVQEHEKMKADTRASYVNEKLTPSSRHAEMDRHCDALIAAAQQQLALLQEFAKR